MNHAGFDMWNTASTPHVGWWCVNTGGWYPNISIMIDEIHQELWKML